MAAKRYLQLGKILKKLLFEHNMRPADLASAVDLPAPTIHRLVSGKSTRPYRSSLEPIADYFSVDVEQLLGEKPLSPSDELVLSNVITNISLISWDQLDQREEYKKNTDNNPIPFIGPISKTGFATTMPDSSMEPMIPRNAILILDPEVKPIDRSYILVKLHETKNYILRELLLDADYQYLKPLNPDLSSFKMRLLKKDDQFIACLVEVRHNCRPVEDSKTLDEKKHV